MRRLLIFLCLALVLWTALAAGGPAHAYVFLLPIAFLAIALLCGGRLEFADDTSAYSFPQLTLAVPRGPPVAI